MYFLCLGQKWSSILPCKYIFLSIVRLTARWGIDLLTLHFFSLPLFGAWTLSCFLSSDGDSSAWWIGGWRKVCLIWVIFPLCRWLALQVASELLCCPFFLWAHELFNRNYSHHFILKHSLRGNLRACNLFTTSGPLPGEILPLSKHFNTFF